MIGAMKNPYVKIIGHPDDDRFPLDYEKLVKAAAKEKVALEVNNSSFSPRTGRLNADKNLPVMLSFCKKYKVPVIVDSDAHIFYDIGNLDQGKGNVRGLRISEKTDPEYEIKRSFLCAQSGTGRNKREIRSYDGRLEHCRQIYLENPQ